MEYQVIWRSTNAPKDLPTFNSIIKACDIAGFSRNGVSLLVAGQPRFWVKYSVYDIKGEGLTQAHVAEIVNADPEPVVRVPSVYLIFSHAGVTYLVMHLVEGMTMAQSLSKSKNGGYKRKHMKVVAAAVQRLIQIKVPANTAPGPIGGGCIGHDFFAEQMSTLEYATVGELQRQINEILRLAGTRHKVDFTDEIADGLHLCPSDLDDTNFMVCSTSADPDDSNFTIWAIDFGRTCFLPSSFMYFSLNRASKPFGFWVARHVTHPASDNLSAMRLASYRLVVHDDNTIGARSAA